MLVVDAKNLDLEHLPPGWTLDEELGIVYKVITTMGDLNEVRLLD